MNDSNKSLSNKRASNGKASLEVTTAFHGPLPSPEILDGFEKVLPGAAERIMCMAEKEQSSRHWQERRVTNTGIITMTLGVVFAFLSVLIIGYLIYYSISKEANAVAIALSTTSIVGVAGVFIWFRKINKEESDKRK